ncbi:MAG: alpha/beta hydrolase [Vulcanimicrobiaceae bacterium]
MQRKSFVVACAATALVSGLPTNGAAAEAGYDLVTPTGTLFGTVNVPSGSAPKPVVLILAGSGPTDRDGNSPMLTLNIYRKLADALAGFGVASVRFDKRGIAGSRAALSSEADIRFDTYVADAAAWITKLRGDARFSRVAVAGHSEGSLIGMIAAQRAPVDAFISLDGAGFPASAVLGEQLRAQLQPYPDLRERAAKILTTLANGTTVAAADVPPALMSVFRPSVQPYLISWFKYDPRVEIAKLTSRVTIVHGTHDVQVPIDDGRALAAAHPGASFVSIDGLTHVLVNDPGTTLAEQKTGAYADAARPIDPALVRALVAAVTVS